MSFAVSLLADPAIVPFAGDRVPRIARDDSARTKGRRGTGAGPPEIDSGTSESREIRKSFLVYVYFES